MLDQASGGDAELEREMLAQFRRFNADDVKRLVRGLELRSLDDVVSAAHRIKGAGRTLGAEALAAACERMEAAARNGDWDAIGACRAALEAQLLQVERYIDAALART